MASLSLLVSSTPVALLAFLSVLSLSSTCSHVRDPGEDTGPGQGHTTRHKAIQRGGTEGTPSKERLPVGAGPYMVVVRNYVALLGIPGLNPPGSLYSGPKPWVDSKHPGWARGNRMSAVGKGRHISCAFLPRGAGQRLPGDGASLGISGPFRAFTHRLIYQEFGNLAQE